MRVVVNTSFSGQRVTGQQRYATEIARRLVADPEYVARGPRGVWIRSGLLTWLWLQLVLPLVSGPRVLLSMTSRAPVWSRRQVLVVHDLFVLQHPEWYSRTYYLTHAPLLRLQIRTAAAIVAVSQPVVDELVRHGRTDAALAPNAPSDVFAEADLRPSAVLASRAIAPGSYFLAVGNRDPRKNLSGLAAAYALLSEEERAAHPLLLVGGGASIYRTEDITWADGTVDVGYLDDNELRQLYRDAGTVVFVSLAEGFGLPIVEAAVARCPSLLVSDIPVFRWICGDGARYVDPRSPAAVAAGMRAELAEPTAPQIAAGRFTWEASADAVARVCRDVAVR